MKRVLTTALTFVFALALTAPAFGQINRRQDNQRDRIVDGVKDGELTGREAAKVTKQQAAIQRQESRVKADGVVTARERVRLTRSQNRASRTIRRQKTDDQTRPRAN